MYQNNMVVSGNFAGSSSDKRLHELKLQLNKDVCKHSQKKVVAAIANCINYIRETRKRREREKAQRRLKNALPHDDSVVIILDDDEEKEHKNDANVNEGNSSVTCNDSSSVPVNDNRLANNTIRSSSFAHARDRSAALISHQSLIGMKVQPQIDYSSYAINPELTSTHHQSDPIATSSYDCRKPEPRITNESPQEYLPHYTFQSLVESAPQNIEQPMGSTMVQQQSTNAPNYVKQSGTGNIPNTEMLLKILDFLENSTCCSSRLSEELLGVLMSEVQSITDPRSELELKEKLHRVIERISKNNSCENVTEQIFSAHSSSHGGEVLESNTSVNLLVPQNHIDNTMLNEDVPHRITPQNDPDVEIIEEYFPENKSNHEEFVHENCESRESKEYLLANIVSDNSMLQNKDHDVNEIIADQNNKIMFNQSPHVYEADSVIHNQSEPTLPITTKRPSGDHKPVYVNELENISVETETHNSQNLNKSQTPAPSVTPKGNLTDTPEYVNESETPESHMPSKCGNNFKLLIVGEYGCKSRSASREANIVCKPELKLEHKLSTESGYESSSKHISNSIKNVHKNIPPSNYISDHTRVPNDQEKDKKSNQEIPIYEISSDDDSDSEIKYVGIIELSKTVTPKIEETIEPHKHSDIIIKQEIECSENEQIKTLPEKIELSENERSVTLPEIKQKSEIVSNDDVMNIERNVSNMTNFESDIKNDYDNLHTIDQKPEIVTPNKMAGSTENIDDVAMFLSTIDLLDIPLPPGKPKTENEQRYSTWLKQSDLNLKPNNLQLQIIEPYKDRDGSSSPVGHSPRSKDLDNETSHNDPLQIKHKTNNRKQTKGYQSKVSSKNAKNQNEERSHSKTVLLPKYEPYKDIRDSRNKTKKPTGQSIRQPSKNPPKNKTLGLKMKYKDWDRVEESEPRPHTDFQQSNAIFPLPGLVKKTTEKFEKVPEEENQHLVNVGYETMIFQNEIIPESVDYVPSPGCEVTIDSNDFSVDDDLDNIVQLEQSALLTNATLETTPVEPMAVNKECDDTYEKDTSCLEDAGHKDIVQSVSNIIEKENSTNYIENSTLCNTNDLDNILQLNQSTLLTNAILDNIPEEPIMHKESDNIFENVKNPIIEINTYEKNTREIVTDAGYKPDVSNKKVPIEKEKHYENIENRTRSPKNNKGIKHSISKNGKQPKINTDNNSVPIKDQQENVTAQTTEKNKTGGTVFLGDYVPDPQKKNTKSNKPSSNKSVNSPKKRKPVRVPQLKGIRKILNERRLNRGIGKINTRQVKNNPPICPTLQEKYKNHDIDTEESKTKAKLNEMQVTPTKEKKKTVNLLEQCVKNEQYVGNNKNNKTSVSKELRHNLNNSSSKIDVNDSRSNNSFPTLCDDELLINKKELKCTAHSNKSIIPLFGDKNSSLQPNSGNGASSLPKPSSLQTSDFHVYGLLDSHNNSSTMINDESLNSNPKNNDVTGENRGHATNKVPKLKILKVDRDASHNMRLRKRTLSTYKCIECPIQEEQKETTIKNDKKFNNKNKQTSSIQTRSSTINSIKLNVQNNNNTKHQDTKKKLKSNDKNIAKSSNKKMKKLDKMRETKQAGLGTCSCVHKCPLKLNASKQLHLRKTFYRLGSIERQLLFIRNYLEFYWKISTDRMEKKMNYILRYTLPNVEGKKVRVCKKIFKETLSLSDGQLHQLVIKIINRKKMLLASLNRKKR